MVVLVGENADIIRRFAVESVAIRLVAQLLTEVKYSDGLRLWTTIQLLCDPEDTIRWRKVGVDHGFLEEVLDNELIEKLLDLASEKELASVLATPILKYMPVATYIKFFRRVCATDVDDQTLRAIGFSADMFLDIHPRAFVFPRDLLNRLLSSEDEPLRGIGILLLTHSDVEPRQRIEAILEGIDLGGRPDWRGFDVVCLTAFREFVREHDLSAIGDSYIPRSKEALLRCLARNPDRERSVRQTLGCIPTA